MPHSIPAGPRPARTGWRCATRAILIGALAGIGSGGALCAAQTAPAPAPAAYAGQLAHARARKDSLLRHDPSSPIPASQRRDFAGLRYFPPASQFRIEGTMEVFGRPRQIRIPATGDGTAQVFRYGRFSGAFAGSPFSLEVYRLVEADQLRVFYTDESNGTLTYGGGRYVPVQALGGGRYLIDFNESYNPYCAYDHSYICPLPPPRNHLPFEVLAGEMIYGPDLAPR